LAVLLSSGVALFARSLTEIDDGFFAVVEVVGETGVTPLLVELGVTAGGRYIHVFQILARPAVAKIYQAVLATDLLMLIP
jgi:hypothetical protein